jgi:hypothetical protein
MLSQVIAARAGDNHGKRLRVQRSGKALVIVHMPVQRQLRRAARGFYRILQPALEVLAPGLAAIG